jgi:hypothetical protein
MRTTHSCMLLSDTRPPSRILSRCWEVLWFLASPSQTCTSPCASLSRLFFRTLTIVFRYGYQSVVQAYTLTGDLKIVCSNLLSFHSLIMIP